MFFTKISKISEFRAFFPPNFHLFIAHRILRKVRKGHPSENKKIPNPMRGSGSSIWNSRMNYF